MTRILKLGLLTLMNKTNGLIGLRIESKLKLIYNIITNKYDDHKSEPPYVNSNELKKDTCNKKSGKAIQRIA